MKITLKIPDETKQLWRSLWHNRWLRYSTLALGITIPLTIYAALISIPHTFTGGQLVKAGEVNTNFKTLYDTLGITEAKGLTVGANIEAQGFTLNGTPVGSSNDSFWSVAGTGNIAYNSGNVGIGITPTRKLHVNGTTTLAGDAIIKGTAATGAALNVQNSGGTSMLYVGNDGKVGIGTTSPVGKFQINGTTAMQMYLSGTDGYQKVIDFATGNSIRFNIGVNLVAQGPSNAGSDFRIVRFDNGGGSIGTPFFIKRSNGNVGIGTTTPGAKLAIRGSGTTSGTFGLIVTDSSGAGTLTIRDNGAGWLKAASWLFGSDRRLKKNIHYFDNGLATILRLKPVKFDYTDGSKNQIGFIAQDVKKIIPEAVSKVDPKGMLGLRTNFIIPYLVNAVQKLAQENNKKDKRIQELQTLISSQNKRLDRIERMMARAN